MTHLLTIEFDGDLRPTLSLTCKAGGHAECRAHFTCDCETWAERGGNADAPWHAQDDDMGDLMERHYGTWGDCNLVDWLDSDDEIVRGKITLPVRPEWDYDSLTLHFLPLAATGGGDQ